MKTMQFVDHSITIGKERFANILALLFPCRQEPIGLHSVSTENIHKPDNFEYKSIKRLTPRFFYSLKRHIIYCMFGMLCFLFFERNNIIAQNLDSEMVKIMRIKIKKCGMPEYCDDMVFEVNGNLYSLILMDELSYEYFNLPKEKRKTYDSMPSSVFFSEFIRNYVIKLSPIEISTGEKNIDSNIYVSALQMYAKFRIFNSFLYYPTLFSLVWSMPMPAVKIIDYDSSTVSNSAFDPALMLRLENKKHLLQDLIRP